MSGAKLEKASCTQNPSGGGDCAAGLACVTQSTGSFICMRFCDTSHACKTGQTCEPLYANGQKVPWGGCTPPDDACTPNPCTTPHKTACTVVGDAATCGCDSGYVDMGGTCQCVPQCSGKTCGPDGCGGSCGTCGDTQMCNSAGQCVCKPQCTGKTCGPDGCGGTCGTCGAQSTCNASGQCICTPSCSGKTCGDNGCGGSCGTCGTGVCHLGACCTPSCSGKTCGDNGCGGSCGTCGSGQLCSSGSCVQDPNSCDPVDDVGCAFPNECILLANETTACALAGSGTQGSSCSATVTCAGGYSCFAGHCRKVCDLASGSGCPIGTTCTGVSGWVTHGACG
jgi:hypothetical protein